MRVILAPMEGVVDATMRDLLTRIGGYDLCVTEFIRVVDRLLPERVFYRLCPELRTGASTPGGTPVRIQLLGQDPGWLAENAARAVALGSPGVDINFGCPAKTVNKNRGGAALLKEPELMFRIVRAMREAVPAGLPVTAKVRLGWDDKSRSVEIAQAVADGGASELTVHARTKREGYKPPAHWHYIRAIAGQLTIPVIANGEIWGREDYLKCQEASGCDDIMLGRGALTIPNLARVVRGEEPVMDWPAVKALLVRYSGFEIEGDKGLYYPNRLKQWLTQLKKAYPEADALFTQVRRLQHTPQILAELTGFDASES